MAIEWFDRLPLWILLAILAGLLWLAMEGGYRLGLWRHERFPDEREQPVGAMVASILGLMALILAFTFNLAATRFEARRQAILEEANAIGTKWLRAQTLPDAHREESMRLLQEYTEVRIQGVEQHKLDQLVAQSEANQKELWSHVVEAARSDPASITTGLYMQSLNNVIDLHATRVLVGIRNRIPIVIWGTLVMQAVTGLSAVGYQAALSLTRRSPAMAGLVLAFACILYLIADLDRAHEGLLRISQQPMIDVLKTMDGP